MKDAMVLMDTNGAKKKKNLKDFTKHVFFTCKIEFLSFSGQVFLHYTHTILNHNLFKYNPHSNAALVFKGLAMVSNEQIWCPVSNIWQSAGGH